MLLFAPLLVLICEFSFKRCGSCFGDVEIFRKSCAASGPRRHAWLVVHLGSISGVCEFECKSDSFLAPV